MVRLTVEVRLAVSKGIQLFSIWNGVFGVLPAQKAVLCSIDSCTAIDGESCEAGCMDIQVSDITYSAAVVKDRHMQNSLAQLQACE